MIKMSDNIVGGADQLYKSIIDFLPFYLSVQDCENNILFTNQTYKEAFGSSMSNKCFEKVRCSCFKYATCPVEKSFKDGCPHICEDSVINGAGEVKQVLIFSVPFVENVPSSLPGSVLECLVDISLIKDSQRELSILGQSVAQVSHGIKNMLEGLQGGEYVVDEGIRDKDLLLVERGWGVVKNNISDISVIAQNILYSSKKKSLNIEKVNPAEILKKTVSLLSSKASSMGIQLHSETYPYLPQVKLDPFTIKRMLINLISNALDACSRDTKKGRKWVVARVLAYNEFQFKFEVEDNGIGIDEDNKKKIFKEFFSTRGSRGTGLGLSVVEKIVKEHNGKIEVESKPGTGTLFRIIFRL